MGENEGGELEEKAGQKKREKGFKAEIISLYE